MWKTVFTGQKTQPTVSKYFVVQQLYCATLLLDKVACLTSRVAQLLTSRATMLLDRNYLYSSAISRSVAEL